ncbi:hypothetical protein BDP27DRAFT_1429279 [Rhodocollybia butyracea]|uniref:Uncharacterized protein n=1 Tax=Rhodocollybia butyracea TaxID=206335 RepID=A0A9P5PDD0_9AGAR|nr:hypothetical protein BDP27DRAFT_1429279 [Rhodocollybia butyracea]
MAIPVHPPHILARTPVSAPAPAPGPPGLPLAGLGVEKVPLRRQGPLGMVTGLLGSLPLVGGLIPRRQAAPTDTSTCSPATIPVCCDNNLVTCSLLSSDDVCDSPSQALCCEFDVTSSDFQCFATTFTPSGGN